MFPIPTLPFTRQTLAQNFERVPAIAFYFARELLNVQWGFVFPLALVLLLARWLAREDAPIFSARAIFLLAPLFYLLIMASAYIFPAFTSYRAHLANSGYRLVAQVVPFVIVWLAIAESITEPHETRVTP